ncbi:MAG: dienelactone hydrolase family protein [Kiloniellales bacterium]
MFAERPRAKRQVTGLRVPPRAAPAPWRAVALLHGSAGLGAQERYYAGRLAEAGYAVLLIDSFGPRGVEKTVEDQTLVSESSMLADAFAGLLELAHDPRVDPRRVAVLGFSKGGTVALYASFERIARRLLPGGPRFAAHAAFYPWCGLTLLEATTDGGPILIQMGAEDEITLPEYCDRVVGEIAAADPAKSVELVIYPGVGHAFDHPLLGDLWLPVGRKVPNRCHFAEVSARLFVEASSGRKVTSDNLVEALDACSSPSASIDGDSETAALAEARLLSFLAIALQ